MVARNLEKQWEQKLRAAEKVAQEYQAWCQPRTPAVSTEVQRELLALGENLPKIWYASTTTPADKKRIIRLVIREVIMDKKRQPGQVWLQLNWQTGAITQHWITYQPSRYAELRHADILQQRLRELKAEGQRDIEIVEILRAEGYRALQGGEVTRDTVWHLRQKWGIASPKQARKKVTERWPDGSYTLQGVASVLGVHMRTVHGWIAKGRLEAHQPFKHSPWKIPLTKEKLAELREYVAHARILPRSVRGPKPGVYKNEGDHLN